MTGRRCALVIALAAAAMAGCATTGFGTGWDAAPASARVERGGRYSVELPRDWVYREIRSREQGDALVATRDGPLLQRIVVDHRRNDRAFPGTEREASPGMLPQELAERFIAETASSFELDVVDVLSNEPATLAGIDGFRVHLEFRAGELRYQLIAHGMSTAAGFVTLGYVAPVLHYFGHDQGTFERVVGSFRLLDDAD